MPLPLPPHTLKAIAGKRIRENILSGEAAVQGALKDAKEKRYKSLRASTTAYGVPYSTAHHREHGRLTRTEAHISQQALTPGEEEVLLKYIKEAESWGFPLRVCHLLELAEDLAGRKLSKQWPTRFIARHGLRSCFVPAMDANRAHNHDPAIIHQWIGLLGSLTKKHNIPIERQYNMDEKGILLGQGRATRVIVSVRGSKQRSKAFTQQLGTRELVTAIECICGDGSVLDPLIIYKAAHHQERWVRMKDNRMGWSYATSSRGWTDDELGFEWLKIFDKQTRIDGQPVSRILILDNHGSHVTGQCIRYCIDNNIILIAFPPHCTHLLQPLDVGVFAPLQSYYSRFIHEATQYSGKQGVDKEMFLEFYAEARRRTFTEKNIKSSFKATGIYPLRASPILAKLQDITNRDSNAVAGSAPAQAASTSPSPLTSTSRATSMSMSPPSLQRSFSLPETPPIDPTAPPTPHKKEDIEKLCAELLCSLDAAGRHRVHKLHKALQAARAQVSIKSSILTKYEKYKVDKTKQKRLISKGRVFTIDDAEKAEKEAAERARAAEAAAKAKAYEDGEFAPEIDAANHDFFIQNPAEVDQDWSTFSHVLRVKYQGADQSLSLREWQGRGTDCGSRFSFKIEGFKFEPPGDSAA